MHGMDCSEKVHEALATVGCRPTPQRVAVLAYLRRVDCHPTTDEVYRAVRRELPRISLATVYNSLEALVSSGLAVRLSGADGTSRYDARTEDHYHLRDTATGEIRDLALPYDPALLERIDPRLAQRLSAEGFEVTGYRLEVMGRFREAGDSY
jgi:Fur family peroxide stress response transcriptional regulator